MDILIASVTVGLIGGCIAAFIPAMIALVFVVSDFFTSFKIHRDLTEDDVLTLPQIRERLHLPPLSSQQK